MREPPGRLLEMSWDGFQSNLLKELCWFWRNSGTLSDVTIYCEGGSLRAHKLVLALSSPSFLSMCLETHGSCGNSVISLKGVELEDLKTLVEFMYKGKAHVDEGKVEKITELARSLCVRGFGEPSGRVPRRQQRNGSVESVFGDSDNEEVNEKRVYIRPEEIALDDLPPNRVTRASINAHHAETSKPSRRLSDAKGDSPKLRPTLATTSAKTPERSREMAHQSSRSPQLATTPGRRQKLSEKSPTNQDSDIHSKNQLHRCKSCDFSSSTPGVLAMHCKRKHSSTPLGADTLQPEIEMGDGAPDTRKSTPESAHKEPPSEASVDPETSDGRFSCDICGFVAGNAGALGNHKNRHKIATAEPSTPPSSSTPAKSSQSPVVPSITELISSEHYKLIYDCPKCISISFKTPAIMTRHLLKRHPGEAVLPHTRAKCSHCEQTFLDSEATSRPDTFANHLLQIHNISLSSLHKPKDMFVPIQVKLEPLDMSDQEMHDKTETGVNGAVELHLETASNADTERASSRGSFVMSPSGSIKKTRLSHDDEATIETEIRVKKELDDSVFHKCHLCNYQTSLDHFMKRHVIACHNNGKTEDPFLCRYCNFSTANRSTIKSHLVMVHRDVTTKVRDCFRNLNEIKLLGSKKENGGVSKKPRKTLTEATLVGEASTSSMVARTSSGEESKKRGRPPKSRQPSTPIANAKKSPKKQNLDAALKLKKAALLKQRRRTEPKGGAGKLKRVSNRLSTGGSSDIMEVPKRIVVSKYALKDLKCPDCTYVARSMLMFEKHTQLHVSYDETKLALCELCGVVKLKGSMGYHMKKHEEHKTSMKAIAKAPMQ